MCNACSLNDGRKGSQVNLCIQIGTTVEKGFSRMPQAFSKGIMRRDFRERPRIIYVHVV